MKVRVAPCQHGHGVFALVKLYAGEQIAVFDDMRLTTEPTSPPEKRWALIVGQSSQGKPIFWDEEPVGSRYYWTNFLDHDKHPNVKFKIDLGAKVAILVTTKAVKAGEELFLNYHHYDKRNWP